MIKINVDTSWVGNIAIRDKYIKRAEAKGEDIRITLKGKIMTIPFEELKIRLLFRSPKPFIDRFSKEKHYLCYFKWREDKPKLPNEPKQAKLI